MSAMAEKQLIMLKLVDQTPVLAGCSGCNLKFFVPKGLMKDPFDPFQANNYLLSKFDRHVRTGEDRPPKKAHRQTGRGQIRDRANAESSRTALHVRLQLAGLARLGQWPEVVSTLN
jgi:hypothetical protein